MKNDRRCGTFSIEAPAAVWVRFHVGMRVTVREREEAYYSGYAERPVCYLEPGMAGTIAMVDVPYVRRTAGRSESFACVDFLHPHVVQCGDSRERRAGVDPKNLVPLDRPPGPRPGRTLRLVASPEDHRALAPYTAWDRAILRACSAGAGHGVFGAAELREVRGKMAEHGYAVVIVENPVLELAF